MPNPSVVQSNFIQELEPYNPNLAFLSDVTAGNYLIASVRWRYSTGATPFPTDTRGNFWKSVVLTPTRAIWVATAKDSGPLTFSTAYEADFIPYNCDFAMLEVDGAGATFFADGASGNSPDAVVSAGGLSIDAQMSAHAAATWAAGMLVWNNADGVADDGLAIAIVFADNSFGAAPGGGWSRLIPAYVNTWSDLFTGPGAIGSIDSPPVPGVTACPATCQTNLSDTDPPAPSTAINVRWQSGLPYLDPGNPQETIRDVSAYVPKATATSYGVVLLGGTDSTQVSVNGVGASPDRIFTVNSLTEVNGAPLP